MKLLSTEQVSKYHPDKFADGISDAILTECLKQDKYSRVGCECLVKDYTVVLGGEITTNAIVDYEAVVQKVAKDLNYKVDKVINLIGKQSNEIAKGVEQDENIGAGDQGFVTGFATRETESMLPYNLDIANKIIQSIEADIENNSHTILKGDAKCQVTVDLNNGKGVNSLHTILISVCHNEGLTVADVKKYIHKHILVGELDFSSNKTIRYLINPAGEWTQGGAIADCGLTGRKIVCDQYGGAMSVGGGAFSGKDPTKVDRSGAYMARYLAKWVLKENSCVNWCTIQLAYAIGVSEPVSIIVAIDDKRREYSIQKLTTQIKEKFNLTPKGIIEFLDLYNVDYYKLSQGCHYRKLDGIKF